MIDQISETQAPGVAVLGQAVTLTITPSGTTVFTATQTPDAIVSVNAVTHTVNQTLALAGSPTGLAVSPDSATLYVLRCSTMGNAGCGTAAVDVISASTLTVLATIAVPQGEPQGISLNPNGAYAYVTTGSTRRAGMSGIVTIALSQNMVSGFLPSTQALLGDIVTLPSGTEAFVSDLHLPLVHRIDLTTGQGIVDIAVKSAPTGMALSADGAFLYVAGQDLTAIDTQTNTVSFHSYITALTAGVTASPDGSKCYVADYFGSTLDTFDLATRLVTARVPTGFRPVIAVVAPRGGTAFVANSGSSTISQIDETTNQLVAQAEAGSEPIYIEKSPRGKYLYAVNAYSSNVSALSSAPLERLTSIATEYLPTASAISPDGTRLYVNTYEAVISVIDTVTQKLIGNVLTSPGGSSSAYGMAVSSNGKTLYALTSYNLFAGILVIDTATLAVVKSIPVVGDISQIALGPQNDLAYISGDSNQPFLIVVDLVSGTQLDPIYATKPLGVKVSPRGLYIYTGTTDSTAINVINRSTGIVTSVPVAGTVAITLNASGTRLYASGPVVSVFDTENMQVIATVDTGGPSLGLTAQ